MRKEMKMDLRTMVAIGVVALVIVSLSAIGLVKAYNSEQPPQVVIENVEELVQNFTVSGENLEDISLGAGTRFPNGLSVDSTSPSSGQIRGTTLNITATTTRQELTLGSRYNTALSFTSSSTAGGLFSFQNTGAPKICQDVIVEISTADTAGGATGAGGRLGVSVATSSAASSFPDGGTTLIASSTLATSTAGFLSSIVNTGSYATDNSDPGAPWLWENGVYILGQFAVTDDNGTALNNATSSAYSGNAGEAYVNCITR